jgi:hypothetical protein
MKQPDERMNRRRAAAGTRVSDLDATVARRKSVSTVWVGEDCSENTRS